MGCIDAIEDWWKGSCWNIMDESWKLLHVFIGTGPTLLIRLSGVGSCCVPELAGSKLTVALDTLPAAKDILPPFVLRVIVGDAITESCGWSDVVGDGFMSTSGPTAFTPSTFVRRPNS